MTRAHLHSGTCTRSKMPNAGCARTPIRWPASGAVWTTSPTCSTVLTGTPPCSVRSTGPTSSPSSTPRSSTESRPGSTQRARAFTTRRTRSGRWRRTSRPPRSATGCRPARWRSSAATRPKESTTTRGQVTGGGAMPDWTTMVKEVVVAGRPADVESAALGWEALLQTMGEVKQSLDDNVKDVGSFWKGQAYDDFKKHIDRISTGLQDLIDQAKRQGGISQALKDAAQRLAEAQAAMPVPAECIGDILNARNGVVTIPLGFCEAHLRGSFFNNPAMKFVEGIEDTFRSLLSDVEGDAQRAYDKVNGDYKNVSRNAPASVIPRGDVLAGADKPDLTGGGPGTGPGGVPKLDPKGPPGTDPFANTPPKQDPWGYGSDGSGDPYVPETGLAGAGGGPVGAGLGAGSGLGGSGLGGLGGGLGAGGAGAGRGGRPGAGMMGGGHGGGAGGDGDERTTWLQEDEDPWGADNDAPPPVLT